MPPQQPKPQAPHRIHWILGWVSLGFGLLFLACGYYLAHEDIARVFGLILSTVGGIGVGAGGRVLISCYMGLKKFKARG